MVVSNQTRIAPPHARVRSARVSANTLQPAAGRLVEINLVKHDCAAHEKPKFAAFEAHLTPAVAIKRRLQSLDSRRFHFVEPLLGPLAAVVS